MRDEQLQHVLMKQSSEISVTSIPQSVVFRTALSARCGASLTELLIWIWLSPGQIGSLQATQMSHEATIRNLDQEQNRLKEKISRLEEEREALLNQSQVANEQHKQQVLKLEQVLGNTSVQCEGSEQLADSLKSLLSLLLSHCARSTRVTRRSSPGSEVTMRRRCFASGRPRSGRWRRWRRSTRSWRRRPSRRSRRRRNSSWQWVKIPHLSDTLILKKYGKCISRQYSEPQGGF